MSTNVAVRGKTGERCSISGDYKWDGYTDGSVHPAPTPAEMHEPIAQHNVFPPIRSTRKACYWLLVRRL
ncbi:MAG TPA: hypothetical protein VGM05_18560 [Planctomycetaceae bacterium]|jgi:hypothetical protein